MATPQFVNVGASTSIDLQSLKAVGEDASDSVFIETLDSNGFMVDTYSWIDYAGDEGDQEAWVDGDYEIVTDVSFEPGQGLWIQGGSAAQAVQSAGKVSRSDLSVQLCSGFTATGNPFPTTVDLQDIIPVGDDVSDSVFIETLDEHGFMVDTYSWIDYAGDEGDQEAWVDGDYEIVTDVTFAPGQGLWVQGGSNTQYLRFPAPEL